MLNKKGENGHPCFVPDGSIQSSTSHIKSALSFFVYVFVRLKKFSSIPIFLSVFIKNECQILSYPFSASTDMVM